MIDKIKIEIIACGFTVVNIKKLLIDDYTHIEVELLEDIRDYSELLITEKYISKQLDLTEKKIILDLL